MSFSRGGSSTTSTANQTENVSAPLNQQDTQGIAIGSAGGSVTIQQLDAGAIQNATDLAYGALKTGQNNLDSAAALVQKVALQSTQSALDFGARSLSTVDSAFAKASAAQFDATAQVAGASRLVADAYSGASSSVIDSVSGFFKSALSFVGDLQSNSQTQLGNTVTALNTIAKENSTSADQRVAQVSTDAIRYVVYGVAALAAAGALFAIFRSR